MARLFEYEEAEEKEAANVDKNGATGLQEVIRELENLKKCYWGEDGAVMKPVSFGEYIQEIVDMAKGINRKGIYIPVRVGDTVYIPYSRPKYVKKAVVEGISIEGKDIKILTDFCVFSVNDIGVTMFLTEEDAEKALERR